MTRVRIEDLPPKLRKQIEEKAASSEVEKPEAARRGRRSTDRGPAYRCHTCGATFGWWGKAAEDHADSHGGARMEAILASCPTPSRKPAASS